MQKITDGNVRQIQVNRRYNYLYDWSENYLAFKWFYINIFLSLNYRKNKKISLRIRTFSDIFLSEKILDIILIKCSMID